ncbi:MAG: hypothetical protein ACHQAX_02880 [Gammaproteobacteria bacterium]
MIKKTKIVIECFPGVLVGYAEKQKNHDLREKLLRLTASQETGSIGASLFQLIVFLEESERMLNKATDPARVKKANEYIRGFFSELRVLSSLCDSDLNLNEAVSFVGLMKKVLEHSRFVKLNNKDDIDKCFEFNLRRLAVYAVDKARRSFGQHVGGKLTHYDADIKVFVDFLLNDKLILSNEKLRKELCSDLMNAFKTFHDKHANHYITSFESAHTYNQMMDCASKAAKNLRSVLSYEDVSWIKDVKSYDMVKFNHNMMRMPDVVSAFMVSGAVVSFLLYLSTVKHLFDDAVFLSKEEMRGLHQDKHFYEDTVYLLAATYLAYLFVRGDNKDKRKFIIFPSVALTLDELFDKPCEWGPKEIDEDVFYDAEQGKDEDLFFDAVDSSVMIKENIAPLPVRKFLSEERMHTLLKDTYRKVKNEVESRAVGAGELFGETARPVVKAQLNMIRLRFFDLEKSAHFFMDDQFKEDNFRDALINEWNSVLDANDLPVLVMRIQQEIKVQKEPETPRKFDTTVVSSASSDKIQVDVDLKPSSQVAQAPLVIFSKVSSADPVLVKEVVSCARRYIPRVDSDDGAAQFEALLVLKYDLSLICKALCFVEHEDNALYNAMISNQSYPTPQQMLAELEDENIENSDDQRIVYYTTALEQLCSLKNFNVINGVPLELSVETLPTNVNNADNTLLLQNKLDALKTLINSFHEKYDLDTVIPPSKKKAYIMAIVESFKMWEQMTSGLSNDHLLEVNDHVLKRFQGVKDALSDYSTHKTMDKMQHEDLRAILENKAFIYEVHGSKPKMNNN